MNTQKSNFIVLEGLDGTGKSTQVNLLKEYFQSEGKDCFFVHFPRTDEESPVFGQLIARFLRGEFGSIDIVHPDLVALLYAGDRKNASDLLKKQLHAGKSVIADRYVFSNIGFQCAKLPDETERIALMNRILSMEYDYFKIPEPDISIFLHVPIAFVEQQLSKNRTGTERDYLEGKSDIHELHISFQKDVEQVYLTVCQRYPDKLKYINCAGEHGEILSPLQIHQKITELLRNTGIL